MKFGLISPTTPGAYTDPQGRMVRVFFGWDGGLWAKTFLIDQVRYSAPVKAGLVRVKRFNRVADAGRG